MMMCSFLILAIVPDQADWSLTPPYGVFAWPHCEDVRFIIAVGVLIAVGHLAITVAVQNLPLLVASVSLTTVANRPDIVFTRPRGYASVGRA